MPDFRCDRCGDLCDPIETTESEVGEAWGVRFTHVYHVLISRCCGEPVYEDEENEDES